MIIATYAGAGKTTFAAQIENAIDLHSMPYNWILPPADGEEHECEKAAPYLLAQPQYPDNYILEILKAESQYDYVLIPTSSRVIDRLQTEYRRTVLLCYPTDNLKEEYRARYLARRNSEEFLRLFVDNWESFLQPIRENTRGIHLPMNSGEYLTDLLPRLDVERTKHPIIPVPNETIAELESIIREAEKDLVLYVAGERGRCMYRIPDFHAPEERRFLYDIGQMTYRNDDLRSIVVPAYMFQSGNNERQIWTDDKAQLLEFIESSNGGHS